MRLVHLVQRPLVLLALLAWGSSEGCAGGSCGDTDSGASIDLRLQPVPPTGRLSLEVSSEQGSVTEASVTVDGDLLGKTDAAGVFDVELPTGRHRVKVTAPGFMDWEHDLPVFGRSWQDQISMARLSPPTLVTADQATPIKVGAAALVFPAGAYANDVEMQAALVEGTNNANPGSYMFTDEGGTARVVVYALHVRLPSEPATAATLEIAPPPGTPTDALLLFHLNDAGDATEPIAPTQVVDGKAVFPVAHFSDLLLTAKATGEVARIRALAGLVEVQVPPDTSWARAQPGQRLPEGTILRTRGGSARLSYPSETEVFIDSNSTFLVSAQTTAIERLGTSYRRISVWSMRLQKRLQKKFRVRNTYGGTCSVRGSIASWESAPLAQDPSLEEIDFQVYEGEGVCTLASGEEVVIPQGQWAVGVLPVGTEGTPGTTDAGTSDTRDAGADGSVAMGATLQGGVTLVSEPMQITEDPPCVAAIRIDLDVTVTNFDGAGSPSRPYTGDVSVSGAASSPGCPGGVALPTTTGRIGGLQGEVGFDLAFNAPPRYQVVLSNGLVEGPARKLTGDIVLRLVPEGIVWLALDGVIELREVD